MAGELTRFAPRSLNPLVFSGASMATPALMIAKFAFIVLLASGFLLHVGEPYAPLMPAFERLSSEPAYTLGMPALFLIAGLCLLFNRIVRAASFTVGVIVLVTLAQSLPAWSTHALLCGVLLVLCGLHGRDEPPRLVRWQLVLFYGYAALEQLLSPEWRSGAAIERLLTAGELHPLAVWAASFTSPAQTAAGLAWFIIGSEALLMLALAVRPLRRFGVWYGIVFHVLVYFAWANTAVGFFSIAIGLAYLSYMRWPAGQVKITWPRACGLPMWVRIALDRFDWDGRFEWPFPPDPDEELEVEYNGRRIRGRRALCDLLLHFPPFHVVIFALLLAAHVSLPHTAALIIQIVILIAVLGFFFAPVVRRLQFRWRARTAAAGARP